MKMCMRRLIGPCKNILTRTMKRKDLGNHMVATRWKISQEVPLLEHTKDNHMDHTTILLELRQEIRAL